MKRTTAAIPPVRAEGRLRVTDPEWVSDPELLLDEQPLAALFLPFDRRTVHVLATIGANPDSMHHPILCLVASGPVRAWVAPQVGGTHEVGDRIAQFRMNEQDLLNAQLLALRGWHCILQISVDPLWTILPH